MAKDPASNLSRVGRGGRWTLAVASALVSLLILGWAADQLVRRLADPVDLLVLTGKKEYGTKPNRLAPWAEWADIDAFSAYRAKPGRYDGTDKTVNRHGFISTPEIEFEKPAGTIRVVFLGGSSTAGTGGILLDRQTWPWQTIEILERRFPERKIEFINAALGGYSSFESYGRLWSRVRFFDPDIVVVYHAWNELYYWNDADHARRWRIQSDGGWQFDRPIGLFAEVYKPLAIDRWIAGSQLLSRARIGLTRPKSGELEPQIYQVPEDYESLSYDPRAEAVWRTNLRLIRDTTRVLDAELYVVKQATLIVAGLPAEQRARTGYRNHGFGFDGHVAAFQKIYDVIDDELPASHVIDATTLSGQPSLFYDHVHPTLAGAKAIAAIVAGSLASSPRLSGLAPQAAAALAPDRTPRAEPEVQGKSAKPRRLAVRPAVAAKPTTSGSPESIEPWPQSIPGGALALRVAWEPNHHRPLPAGAGSALPGRASSILVPTGRELASSMGPVSASTAGSGAVVGRQ